MRENESEKEGAAGLEVRYTDTPSARHPGNPSQCKYLVSICHTSY